MAHRTVPLKGSKFFPGTGGGERSSPTRFAFRIFAKQNKQKHKQRQQPWAHKSERNLMHGYIPFAGKENNHEEDRPPAGQALAQS